MILNKMVLFRRHFLQYVLFFFINSKNSVNTPSGYSERNNRDKDEKNLLLFLITTAGCGTTQLNPEAENIEISKTVNVTGHKKVQTISCSAASGFRKVTTNIISCRNELKNKAHAAGAKIVLIESEQLGDIYCATCVHMVGTAYK